MLKDPSKIAFENSLDIVDYVSKGFIPRKKHMDEVVSAILAYSDDADVESKAGKETVIHRSVSEEFVTGEVQIEDIVKRIYKNRKRNRNTVLAVGGVVLVGLLVANGKHKKKEEPTLGQMIDNEFDRLNSRIDAMEMVECL